MPTQRLGMQLRDQSIEQIVLVGCRRAVCLERLIRGHIPTNRSGLTLGVYETEGVQGVEWAVAKSGRERMAADDLQRRGGLRVLRQKGIHRAGDIFSGGGIGRGRQLELVE